MPSGAHLVQPIGAVLWVVSALFLAAGSPTAHCAGTVIYDSGQTVPIAQFLAPAFDTEEQPRAAVAQGAPVPPDPKSVPLPVTFPVVTPSMKAGPLTQRPESLKAWLPSPIFLVGVDEFSRTWLARNREALLKRNATGIVIDVPNMAAFRALQALGQGLLMAPASAEELSKQLRLKTYPVLIQIDGTVSQ